MVSLLSEQGLDLNEGNKQHTPLTMAIMQNDRKMACKLLELGADPNIPSNSGMKPLALAVCENSTELVKALILKGVDLNELIESTAISYHVNLLSASKLVWEWSNKHKEHPPVLETNIREVDSTALALAVELRHTEIVQILQEAGAR
jgi:ankyrin repeat protein